MSTTSISELFAERAARYTQPSATEQVKVFEAPKAQVIVIKPQATSWEVLERKLQQVINLPGLWTTVREYYDQGQGAELETAAEIALATAKKSPYNLFAAMVSKKSGNWVTRTLKMVQETWSVRRNALEVMDKLKLKAESAKAILALSWRLRGTIIRFLGIATEQGTGIKNPAGIFFSITKQPKTQQTAA